MKMSNKEDEDDFADQNTSDDAEKDGAIEDSILF